MINKSLIESLGVSEEKEALITDLHKQLSKILQDPRSYSFDNKAVATKIESLEFELQEAWGFPKDANYHKHWSHVKGCRCPTGDNLDYYGTEFRRVNQGCPFHN